MSEDLIQAPAATDKPSGDHPVSEFEAKAREIAGMIYATAALTRSSAIDVIATALAEAVAAEREACAQIADDGAAAARAIADGSRDDPQTHSFFDGISTEAKSIANAIRSRSTQRPEGSSLREEPIITGLGLRFYSRGDVK